jgi:hypothetical protein
MEKKKGKEDRAGREGGEKTEEYEENSKKRTIRRKGRTGWENEEQEVEEKKNRSIKWLEMRRKGRAVRNKKFWEGLIAYFTLTRHGPHGKRRVRQFCCFSVCIRCHGNVFNKQLPSNERGIHVQTHRLMGRIYEARR